MLVGGILGEIADGAEVGHGLAGFVEAVDGAGGGDGCVVAEEFDVSFCEVVCADDGCVVWPGDVGVVDGFLGPTVVARGVVDQDQGGFMVELSDGAVEAGEDGGGGEVVAGGGGAEIVDGDEGAADDGEGDEGSPGGFEAGPGEFD